MSVLLPDDEIEAAAGWFGGGRLAGLHLSRFSGLFVWGAFALIYGLWIPHTFLSLTTFQSVAAEQAITGFVALGLVVSLSAGAFDLSFPTVLTMTQVILASMMAVWHVPWVLAVLLTLLAGCTVGVINGLLVTKVGIPSIVATLAMSSLCQAVIDQVTNGGQFISGFPQSFLDLTTPKPFGIPILAVYLFVAAVVVWYVLEHSRFGRRLQAAGAGPEAARLAGVNTNRMVFAGLVISSLMATLAGILVTSQNGAEDATIGAGFLLPAFAAVFLGQTQIKVGRYNVWGTMVAIYLLATGEKGLQLLGGQGWVTDAFNGAALLIAVSLAVLSQRRQGRAMRRQTSRNLTPSGGDRSALQRTAPT